MVRANADRRRVSMARYLIELGLAEERPPQAGPSLALTPTEQGEVLATVTGLAPLVHCAGDTETLVEEMHRCVAVMFDAWAVEMARAGGLDDVRAIVGERADAASAERFVDRIEALAEARAPRAVGDAEPRPDPKEPPAQGSLF